MGIRLPAYNAPAKKSISLPWHSSAFRIVGRIHGIVRGRLNKFLKPRHPASLGAREFFFGGSGYYTHNTQGYLARLESLAMPFQDKSFLQ